LQDYQLRRQGLKDNQNDTHPVGMKAQNFFGLYDMLGSFYNEMLHFVKQLF